MIRHNFFRALNPDSNYPTSPLNLTAHGIKYDLPVPDVVADALARELSPTGAFLRAEEFCEPTGIDALSSHPAALESFGQSAYAESEFQLTLVGFGNQPMGYYLHQAVANQPATVAIIGLAVEERRFPTEVADWIIDRKDFFLHCHGFEIARFAYYFDGSEKAAVDAFTRGHSVSRPLKSLSERAGRRLRFRDMVKA